MTNLPLPAEYIWKVARYTSAAPMYFTESDNYVDGGVIANNPCIDGLNKIQSFYKEQGVHIPITCMVSLGSGISPSKEEPKFTMFRKAQNLISMLSSAVSCTESGPTPGLITPNLPSFIVGYILCLLLW